MSSLLFFDLLLMAIILMLGWQLLATADIFKAVVLFISFGLLMSIAWVRLRAPDLAMAEAALGAGMSGPLFLGALRRIERFHKDERRMESGERDEE